MIRIFRQLLIILLYFLNFSKSDDDQILIQWNTTRWHILQLQQELLKKYLNPSVDKCSEFMQYSCGNWGKYHDKGDTNPYNAIQSLNDDIRLIVYRALKNDRFFQKFRMEHPVRMAKDYFDSCMDLQTIRNRGNKPLLDIMKTFDEFPALDSNKSKNYDWLKALAKIRLYGENPLISIPVDVHYKNSKVNAIYIDQANIGSSVENKRSEIIEILTTLGASKESVEESMDNVTAFENDLNELIVMPQDLTHRAEIYDDVTIEQLDVKFKEVNWLRLMVLLQKRPADGKQRVLAFQKYLKELMPVLSKTPSSTILDYLLIKFIDSAGNYIQTQNDDGDDDKNRWMTCTDLTMQNMDMAIANLFIKRFLRGRKRRDIDNIARSLKLKFIELFENADWMDETSKTNAIKKLRDMYFEIGFPEFITKRFKLKKWFNGIEINRERFFENTMELIKLRNRRDIQLIGIPGRNEAYDTYDQAMTEMGAHYDVGRNKITILAGLLQLPYYHPIFPNYMKYGIIGSIVGHEMTHGFDNFGRLYDKNGAINNWWTESSSKAFNERSACLVEQFENLNVPNGNFSLLEIIADNNGVKIAYLAYKDWLKRNGRWRGVRRFRRRFQFETIPDLNLTSEQLYFVAYTQWRCDNGYLKLPNYDSPHPDEPIRVIGSLSNLQDFARDFNCPAGSEYNPEKRCVLW